VITKPRRFSNLALALYSKYLIFDFATAFARDHASIRPANAFEINDSIFGSFLEYIKDKDYNYTTKSERALEALKAEATRENYYEAMRTEYDLLKGRMETDKKDDLKKYKDQVEELLKMEIVTRYYYQKGKIKASLESDPEIKKAIELIGEKEVYSSILSGSSKKAAEKMN
jgi:carboxyl-terminal processing protease